MTLRLTEDQSDTLRRRAAAEHRSMQQVALSAIDAYLLQPTAEPQRRQAVGVAELLSAFSDLPPMDVDRFRADQEREADPTVHFDALNARVNEHQGDSHADTRSGRYEHRDSAGTPDSPPTSS